MTEQEAIKEIRENICNGRGVALFCRDGCMYAEDKCAYNIAMKALEEMARIKSLQEDDKRMCEVTEELASYVCDKLCKHSCGSSQEELEEKCENCKLESFIKDIMAEYNIIIDFDNTETMKLMTKYQGYLLCDECQYCEVGEEDGMPFRWCRNKEGLDGHLEPGTGCTRGTMR